MIYATAILSRSGKVLLTRYTIYAHNVGVSTQDIESVIFNYPKLLKQSKKNTNAIHTERYTIFYVPLENLYILVVGEVSTTDMIGEFALQKLSEFLSRACHPLTSQTILSQAYILLFGIDEILASGFPEDNPVSEVMSAVRMYSYQEELHIREMKEREKVAEENALNAAEKIQREKDELLASRGGSNLSSDEMAKFYETRGGFSSDTYKTEATSYNNINKVTPKSIVTTKNIIPTFSPDDDDEEDNKRIVVGNRRKNVKGTRMTLGKRKKTAKGDRISKLAKTREVVEEEVEEKSIETVEEEATDLLTVALNPMTVYIEEKLNLQVIDGEIDKFIAKGHISAILHDKTMQGSPLSFKLELDEDSLKMFKVPPKIRKLFNSEQTIDWSSGFFVDQSQQLVSWSKDLLKEEVDLPINVSIWPTAMGTTTIVSVELELDSNMYSHYSRLQLFIPLPQGCTATQNSCDFGRIVSSENNILIWDMKDLNAEEMESLTLEFSINVANNQLSFYPIEIKFVSSEISTNLNVLKVLKEDETEFVHSIVKQTVVESFEFEE
eukprot:TRINITY_DN3157_c4_g6_i2.p1 TRINITY_DN3157_c4_g6~~TRINITY_DN3157_c4_g6_i2.p1  ORF type:complete len:552 (-),score=180.95 TRINITY_DN3157_c4_g6_i2:1548-3203(-)